MDTVFILMLRDVFVDNQSLAIDFFLEMASIDRSVSAGHFPKLDIALVLISDHLDRLDFSKFFEQISQLLLAEVRRNIFNEQV